MGRLRATAPWRLMLAAVFLTGLAQIAVLPPFEGFDETAHWSSLSQIARTGESPVYGQARLDAGLDAYPGPQAHGGTPPDFAPAAGPSYRGWTPPEADDGPRGQSPPEGFAPGAAPNWQAQHPPLYYLALAPVFALTDGWSWVDQAAALRIVSWLIVCAGLAIGVGASAARLPGMTPGLAAVMAAWPFLFPQFFPEMARIGNDSLCLLWLALLWRQALVLNDAPDLRGAVLCGVWLGLGLLTKAFFLPISAGFGLWLAWRWAAGGCSRSLMSQALAAGLAALAVGGWWQVSQALGSGVVTGGDEFIRFAEQGPLLPALAENLTLPALGRGLAAIAASFAWAGTWSLVRPNEVLIAGPVILFGFVFLRFAWSARRGPTILWLPVLLAAPMLAGLVYHLLVRIAYTGAGAGTPGWYLHILAPAFAAVLALGWRGSRIAAPLLAAYSIGFAVFVWTLQLSLFSGCATKGADRRYDLSSADCLLDASQLAALGRPGWAAALLAAAAAFGLWAVMQARFRGHQP